MPEQDNNQSASPKKRKIKRAPRAPKPTLSLEEFIEGANQISSEKRSSKKRSKEDIFLTIAGRSDQRSNARRMLLYINDDLYRDIQRHCMGNMTGIINYLVRRGLNSLIEEKQLIMFEAT